MHIRGERQVLVNLGEAGKGVNEVRMMRRASLRKQLHGLQAGGVAAPPRP